MLHPQRLPSEQVKSLDLYPLGMPPVVRPLRRSAAQDRPGPDPVIRSMLVAFARHQGPRGGEQRSGRPYPDTDTYRVRGLVPGLLAEQPGGRSVRPWGVTAWMALWPSDEAIVLAQTALSIVAWSVLALTAAAGIRRTAVRRVVVWPAAPRRLHRAGRVVAARDPRASRCRSRPASWRWPLLRPLVPQAVLGARRAVPARRPVVHDDPAQRLPRAARLGRCAAGLRLAAAGRLRLGAARRRRGVGRPARSTATSTTSGRPGLAGQSESSASPGAPWPTATRSPANGPVAPAVLRDLANVRRARVHDPRARPPRSPTTARRPGSSGRRRSCPGHGRLGHRALEQLVEQLAARTIRLTPGRSSRTELPDSLSPAGLDRDRGGRADVGELGVLRVLGAAAGGRPDQDLHDPAAARLAGSRGRAGLAGATTPAGHRGGHRAGAGREHRRRRWPRPSRAGCSSRPRRSRSDRRAPG